LSKITLMFMQVRLLNGLRSSLTYKIPDDWSTDNLVGALVQVPLKQRVEVGMVQEVFAQLPPSILFTPRPARSREVLPHDPFYTSFIAQLSAYYALDQVYFFKRIRTFLQEKESTDIPVHQLIQNSQEYTSTHLTTEQQTIVTSIKPHIIQPTYYPAVINGVTGSGKTEIYKHLILDSLALDKTVLLLLPEVSLAVQFTNLLKKQLPITISLHGFHSATTVKEKRELWAKLLWGQPLVIIGVHLPILLPLPNLGLIIIDEEHDVGFQEKKHPKINTKEAALIRAQLQGIPILLGSATPSITSLYNIEHRGWHNFELKKRFAGAPPTITLVKLTHNPKRKNFWISQELEQAISQNLAKKEQTIIFINRRGYSFFMQCKRCGFIPHCSHCSVSLTLHNTKLLVCHYCNFTLPEPVACQSCKAGAQALLKKGIGTQQVVALLEKLFPHARISRADLDITSNKKRWQETITHFEAGSLDILVGTQTITKGYHFPRVTLVGILWADINLSLPMYNAAEVTLQQLIQVAGRAGRQTTHSHVIVQAMINHPIFNYLNEIDYPRFYTQEIINRQLVSYPPCIRLAQIELKHKDEATVTQESDKLAELLLKTIANHTLAITLLGPTQPPVHMIKNMHMRKIYLKSPHIKELLALYNSIDKAAYHSSLFFTPNPLSQ
jgi:primosomal protein N' (replication factor Y) (superfamily II helicase)